MKCPKRLDDESLRITLPKCHFSKLRRLAGVSFFTIKHLAYREQKFCYLVSRGPKDIKKLRSLLGSVHYIGKFIRNLAQISRPLRPLLRKPSKFIWTEEHEFFFEIMNRIANATENSHYNPQLERHVKCDASHSGLGAALEQLTVDGWKPIAFTSRFLDSCEARYGLNELELLGIVLSIEYFKN